MLYTMTEYPSPSRLQRASAAFALLNLSTNDDIFGPRSQYIPPLRRGSKFQPTTSCDICLGQNIQRKNSRLYHVKMTREHLTDGDDSHIHSATVCGTYTDFICAKTAAYAALDLQSDIMESHESQEDFPELDKWPYEKDVYVRAVAHAGQIIIVSIETESNQTDLVGDHHGEICNGLYYAMQQVIRYSQDRRGLKRETRIDGTFSTWIAARNCAEQSLLKGKPLSKHGFEEYEVFDVQEKSSAAKDDIVHAVASNKDDFLLSVVEVKRQSKACGG